jgi:Lon-like protease
MLVRVMTIHATPNPMTVAAMAPTQMASTLPATTDHARLHQRVRVASGAGRAVTSTPVGARWGRRARAGSAVALAVFRQPVAINATMARPTIQPAAVVTSVILTQSDIVTAEPDPVRAPNPKHRWWAIPLAVLGFVCTCAVLLAAVVPSKFFVDKQGCVEEAPGDDCSVEFALVPADAEPVEPRLDIQGTTIYSSDGEIYFVTIRQPKITMLDWLITRDSPAARMLTHENKFGDQTEEQLLQSGQRQMTGAKDRATYVALKAAGFPVSRKDGAAVVDYTICLEANEANTQCIEEPPAADVLKPNDTITELDGSPVDTLDDLQPILADIPAGDTVSITLERDGETIETEVETIQAPGEEEPRTIIGFSPVDTTTVDLPEGLTVDFDTEGIGGPSAGLAFTLTLIDEITDGNLMGDGRIAVTGEIDIDGNVGAIGGLNSKASAVRQVGVKYFIVPAGQPDIGDDPTRPNRDSVEFARQVVGDDVEIIPVATLDEALAALERLGGDPLPS